MFYVSFGVEWRDEGERMPKDTVDVLTLLDSMLRGRTMGYAIDGNEDEESDSEEPGHEE